MSPSSKTPEDLELVRQIIGVEPCDYARWAGGELAIILPDGRKLILTPAQIPQALQSGEYRFSSPSSATVDLPASTSHAQRSTSSAHKGTKKGEVKPSTDSAKSV